MSVSGRSVDYDEPCGETCRHAPKVIVEGCAVVIEGMLLFYKRFCPKATNNLCRFDPLMACELYPTGFDAPHEVIFVTVTAATARYGRFSASQVYALWDTVSGEPGREYRGVQLILKRRPHVESVRALRHPFGSDDDQQIGALEEFTEGELSNWLQRGVGKSQSDHRSDKLRVEAAMRRKQV